MLLLERCIEVAKDLHKDQKYGNKTYWDGHLSVCLEIAKEFHISNEYILCSIVLHDSLEDTSITYKQLSKRVGIAFQMIPHWVWLVTDYEKPGISRKLKKLMTYQKIRSHESAVIIKLIDRLANVRSKGKNDMYFKEHYTFKCALYTEGKHEKLWNAIEKELGWNLV